MLNKYIFSVTGDKSATDKISEMTSNVDDTRNTRSMSLPSDDWIDEEDTQSNV